jgi:hypothetical protein
MICLKLIGLNKGGGRVISKKENYRPGVSI